MFIWELWSIAILTAFLAAVLLLRLVAGRLILPAKVCQVASVAGFSAFIAYLLLASGSALFKGGGIGAAIWDWWLLAAPLVFPLVAGLVGWVATRSSWRRYFLAAGIGMFLFPWVLALAVSLLGGATMR